MIAFLVRQERIFLCIKYIFLHKVILKESKISPDEYAWEKQAITDNVKFHIIFLGNTWVYLLIS